MSRILSAIGRQERIKPAHRDDILNALATAMRDNRSLRGIYRFIGDGSNDDKAARVGWFGRLDQAYYKAILEITGVIGITWS